MKWEVVAILLKMYMKSYTENNRQPHVEIGKCNEVTPKSKTKTEKVKC